MSGLGLPVCLETRLIHTTKQTRVDLFEEGGEQYVRKTVFPLYGSERLARWLCAREVSALERLRGLQGVQQLVEQDSPRSFVSRYEAGTALRFAKDIPEDYFEKLGYVLAQVHARGVADVDFAHSCDLLVTPSGDPCVLDLASAVIYDQQSAFASLARPVFDLICGLNRSYLARRKIRFLPHCATAEDYAQAHIGFGYETFRFVWKAFSDLKRTLF